ncbi:MAG: hypothetical protein Q7T01_03125 [bacterium]|nr:hypothetical protein [bacterium]
MQRPLPLYDTPTVFRRATAIIVVALILGLLGYRILEMRTPPTLTIVTPADELATSSRIVTIVGQTEPGATVLINGSTLAPDTHGAFETDVVLLPGVNTITIEARRQHSGTARIERIIHVQHNNAPLALQ